MAVSAGIDERFAGSSHPQLVFSGFLGIRSPQLFDLPLVESPVGLRFDVRPATDDVPSTFSVMASFDTVPLGILAVMFGDLFRRHD